MQSFTMLGPLTRSVDDPSLIFPVIAGPDWRDAAIIPMPLGELDGVPIKGLRIAMHTDNGARTPHPEVAQVVTDAAKILEASGVKIESTRPAALEDVLQMDADIYRADGAASLRRILEQAGTTEPGPDVVFGLKQKAMTSGELTAFIERLDAWRGRMLQFMEGYDAILCPPCAFVEMPHGASASAEANSAFSYTFAYNMTGWPAVVVRAGTSSKGQPIGVQIVGRPWREDIVLAL